MLSIKRQALLFLLRIVSFSVVAQDIDELLKAYEFRNVGPLRGGRVTAVMGVESQPSVFYMGATGGGVWKTSDYGITWENISDGYFPTPSIGAIEVYQKNPDIIYVGTGSDGLRSNVITGKGVYKSTDAGKTWSFAGLKETGQIGAVEIHPNNPNTVYVAAIGQAFGKNEARGVFKTTDGGKTWDKIFYHSDSVGVSDLEFAPDDPNTIYAGAWRGERKPWTIISGGTEGGVYKSTDAGKTWNKLTNGLPTALVGKIDFAVSPADPNVLYVNVEASEGQGGLYRSDDRGASFEFVSDNSNLTNRPFYYTNIYANPKNADVVFNSALRFQKSTDGGKTWNRMGTPHGDNHDIWINPNDTSIWVQANDGGANITLNGGKSWSTQFNQPTAELYQVEVDDQTPYWLYAGQQDNSSTIAVPSMPPSSVQAGPNAWFINTGGCETGPAVPKPGNPDIVYSNCKGRFGVFDKRSGQELQYYVGATNIYGHNPKDLKFRFQRVAPIHVSPHNPDVVYHTSQYVHKTTDDGKTWEIISPDLTAFESEKQIVPGGPITRDVTGEEYYSTIYAIRESPIKEGLIWVGANDGPVHVTKDGGKTWENVTPNMPKGGRVDAVEPSPHNPAKAYVSVLRYQLDNDYHPYIYKTEDYGKTWELLTTGSNGLPEDHPTRVVREDPKKEGVLYAGTEFGLFISFNDGKQWYDFNNSLPITPVTDIKIYRDDVVMSTMGRGFWILDNIVSLRELGSLSNQQVMLFDPLDGVRHRMRAGREPNGPEYPSAAVTLDYYIADKDKSVKLEIINEEGHVVRTFVNGRPEPEVNTERDMSTEFRNPPASGGLSNKEGINRFNWNMRHAGGWNANPRRAYQGYGPMVSTGMFKAKLTVDGQVVEKDFNVVLDPRVTLVTDADVAEQEALALEVRDFQSEVDMFIAKVEEARKNLDNSLDKERVSKRQQRQKEALDKVYYQLVTPPGTYMQPMLSAQTGYLGSMIGRADQKPGKDAYDRLEELKEQFEAIKAEFEELQ
ncbi:WD40/YVTN/BNR-like repeat-containing protein [Roseivirga pacifica]|uniref:WD40/YVTN/BNR-like repeat-containing protein n=1 Tax=Roseivirga pacifica TaxID=1267423 RepID=UPI003BA8D48F